MPTTLELLDDGPKKALTSFMAKEFDEWLEKEQTKTREKADKFKAKLDKISTTVPVDQPTKTRQEYLDFIALHFSRTKPSVGPDATQEEKEEDRHRRLCALTTKHRVVFAHWPRDPKGEVIEPGQTEGKGKHAPNGIEAWGNSLFDFFTVQRFPDLPNVVLYTTGSKLLAWMKEHGETYAEDQLMMAENEPEPQEVHPWPVREAFRDIDRRAKMFGRRSASTDKGKKRANVLEFGQHEPFQPFCPAPLLQERVPFRLLPKKLIVHDPSQLLTASYRSADLAEEPKEWDSKPDIVNVYRLHLSEDGKKKLKEEDDALEKLLREDNKAMADFLANPTTENMPPDQGVLVLMEEQDTVGPCPPALFFVHGLTPIKKPIAEAHAYLSPHHLVGRGNHSYAFNIDWEVPRSMVVPDYLCEHCIFEKGMKIVHEEDGPKGVRKNPQWKELSGRVEEVVDFFPGVVVTGINGEGDSILDEDGQEAIYDILPRRDRVTKRYRGPVRVIHTGVEYQNPEDGPLCKHLAEREQPPSLTASVKVVAKLSHRYDDHLRHEAKNYQAFPTHFFQHFTGYNQLRPLHDPFPVGALVPQFFGYYVPEENIPPMIFDRTVPGSGYAGEEGRKHWKETETRYDYRSPIMLLENCGKAIPDNVRALSIDERETCASLFLRMHHAGWIQGSPYPRNILMQSGPIDTFPLNRMVNASKDRHDLTGIGFRLIDFGRAQKFDPQATDRMSEEARVIEMFKLLHHSHDP